MRGWVATMVERVPGVWTQLGDLGGHTQRAWAGLTAGKSVVVQEGLEWKLGAVHQELLGPTPTPLEQLLVDPVSPARCRCRTPTSRRPPSRNRAEDSRRGRTDRSCRIGHSIATSPPSAPSPRPVGC